MSINKGFTLIEVLLYITIVTIIMSALVLFAWNVVILGAKNNTQEELYSQARIVSERIQSTIRNANDINTGTSQFNINLATNPSAQLSLVVDSPNSPTLFSVSSDGILMVKQGAASAVALHSNTIHVIDLTFINYSSLDGKTKHIGYTLQFSYNTSSAAHQYKGTVSIEGGAEIRSNSL